MGAARAWPCRATAWAQWRQRSGPRAAAALRTARPGSRWGGTGWGGARAAAASGAERARLRCGHPASPCEPSCLPAGGRAGPGGRPAAARGPRPRLGRRVAGGRQVRAAAEPPHAPAAALQAGARPHRPHRPRPSRAASTTARRTTTGRRSVAGWARRSLPDANPYVAGSSGGGGAASGPQHRPARLALNFPQFLEASLGRGVCCGVFCFSAGQAQARRSIKPEG
jgi:hypothetical protein